MLESLLSSVIVKLLTKWGALLVSFIADLFRKAKRAVVQKKAIDKLNKDDNKPVRDDETRKDESDYLNS